MEYIIKGVLTLLFAGIVLFGCSFMSSIPLSWIKYFDKDIPLDTKWKRYILRGLGGGLIILGVFVWRSYIDYFPPLTPTPTSTVTLAPTPIPTETPSLTPTYTPTPTPTNIPTLTSTHTLTPPPTNTPTLPPTNSPTLTLTNTPTTTPTLLTSSRIELVVDDQDSGFTRSGTQSYWYEANIGYQGHMWWTFAGDSLDNQAKWCVHLPASGLYKIEVFIPYDDATTERARYTVLPGGDEIPLNQNKLSDEWKELGQFMLEKGQSCVVLTDVTGEVKKRQIGFDAVRWVLIEAMP